MSAEIKSLRANGFWMAGKILVVFYSRTGNTRRVAEAIADNLKCDIEEIKEPRDRAGIMGYLSAGRDAGMGWKTELKDLEKKTADYDLVIVGTPIWSFTLSSPVRTHMMLNKGKFKNAAFFCTYGGNGSERAFAEMEKEGGIKPLATLEVRERELPNLSYLEKVRKFTDSLKNKA
ncbi:Flavodoxin domain protein [uncultured archaeon]|nr:Flavodoxin domain protein [uncultured archaeon]